MIDVIIENSYGFFTFFLETDRAIQWSRANVDQEAWCSNEFSFSCDDQRMAEDIADGMQCDGLKVK